MAEHLGPNACKPSCRPTSRPAFNEKGRTFRCPSCERTWEVVRKHVDTYWRLSRG